MLQLHSFFSLSILNIMTSSQLTSVDSHITAFMIVVLTACNLGMGGLIFNSSCPLPRNWSPSFQWWAGPAAWQLYNQCIFVCKWVNNKQCNSPLSTNMLLLYKGRQFINYKRFNTGISRIDNVHAIQNWNEIYKNGYKLLYRFSMMDIHI